MPILPLSFTHDHPAYAGHFPNRPITPGVLLLDFAQRAVEQQTGLVLNAISAAKFLSPASPGELMTLEYEVAEAVVRFEIRCQTRVIASGRFQIRS